MYLSPSPTLACTITATTTVKTVDAKPKYLDPTV